MGVIREEFERREIEHLSPLALKSAESLGRLVPEPLSRNRTCFQRDRDRIIHSKAFRRLKHKTQVFVANESDHYRSRLTHTVEVAQISRHLARVLRLNEDLSEAISLAHDLGHTPFGHAGEKTLNQLMVDYGGFEHNLQSLRIVDELEQKYPQFPGLNLSYELRHGLMKHSTPYDSPESDGHFDSLEAQVCNLGDEISYNNHDLDDGLRAGILSVQDLVRDIALWAEAREHVKSEYAGLSDEEMTYLINSYLISSQIEDVIMTTEAKIRELGLTSFADLQAYGKTVVSFSKEKQEKSRELRNYLFQRFYMHPHVYRMNKKGQSVIEALFKAFSSDTKLLPRDYQDKISGGAAKERVVCDYIAGMTDTYAQKECNSIY